MRVKGYDKNDFETDDRKMKIFSEFKEFAEERRENFEFTVKDNQKVANAIQDMDNMLNTEKSPIISDFMHLMDYRNGDNIHSYEEHIQMMESGHSPLDQYINDAARLG